MADDRVVKVTCPHCGKEVRLTRDRKGRWLATGGGLTVGAVVGGVIGAGIGLVSGGWGIAATIPLGIAAGSVLGGGGYLIGDKLLDRIKCPACKKPIDLGI